MGNKCSACAGPWGSQSRNHRPRRATSRSAAFWYSGPAATVVRSGSSCNPRPVATGRVSCVCDWLRDVTGLDFGDRSWICNAALVDLGRPDYNIILHSSSPTTSEHKRNHIRSKKFPYLFQTPNMIKAGLGDFTDVVLQLVSVIRRKPVLTHTSIVCDMLASVNSVN